MQSIKDDEEKEKEQNRFDATLEQTKEAHSLARQTLPPVNNARDGDSSLYILSLDVTRQTLKSLVVQQLQQGIMLVLLPITE